MTPAWVHPMHGRTLHTPDRHARTMRALHRMRPPMTKTAARPDMRDYFRARIDWHTNGLMARTQSRIPADVARVRGDVTDRVIVVIMRDGTEFSWSGGQYSARKVNGTYPPLMPKPAN